MDFFLSVTGMLEVELTSADLPGTLARIGEAGILLYRVQPLNDLTLRFEIQRGDHPGRGAYHPGEHP